jgi:hypothetical protein
LNLSLKGIRLSPASRIAVVEDLSYLDFRSGHGELKKIIDFLTESDDKARLHNLNLGGVYQRERGQATLPYSSSGFVFWFFFFQQGIARGSRCFRQNELAE